MPDIEKCQACGIGGTAEYLAGHVCPVCKSHDTTDPAGGIDFDAWRCRACGAGWQWTPRGLENLSRRE